MRRHPERTSCRPSHRAGRYDCRAAELEPRLLMTADPSYYDIGAPTFADVWVDPIHGDDAATGADRGHALRSLAEAWGRIPEDAPLSIGYRVNLVAGDYSEDLLPANGWTAGRRGTYSHPILIDAVDGNLTARLHGAIDLQECSFVYLVGLDFVTDRGSSGGGNTLHLASDDHILVHDCRLNGNDGTTRLPQETLKVNQCQYVYLEDSEVAGAFWFPVDLVAVQYGHIQGCHVHDGGEDGIVLKGGTAQIRVEGNIVDHVGTIGITAGEGTGFEYMVAPWIHYEAYDLQIINNQIHDVGNAGLAARGGYNILMADNTLYRVGQNQEVGAPAFLFSPGSRSCDGDSAACQRNHDLGGWGPVSGDAGEVIPNRNIFVYNNILDNPAGSATRDATFTVFGPVTPPSGTNIPAPVLSDDNLVLRGNIFWDGGPGHDLGLDDALAAQVLRDNTVNSGAEPQFVDPSGGDFRPVAGGNIARSVSLAVPSFPGDDRPSLPLAPQGVLENLVTHDAIGQPRTVGGPIGAITLSPVTEARVQFATTVMRVREDVGTAHVTVLRSGDLTGTVTVAFAVVAGNAVAGRDFLSSWSTLTFAPGETSRTIDVTIIDDHQVEPDLLVGVVLRSADGGAIEGANVAILTILDTDGAAFRHAGDYDGDGKADLALFNPGTATWNIEQSTAGLHTETLGSPGDLATPADYDGDGKTDLAVYHPATGTWTIHQSPAGMRTELLGQPGDVPVPADYDGDGKADLALYNTTTGRWTLRLSLGGVATVPFGGPGAIPVPADYDGDGKADLALFLPGAGRWILLQSTAGVGVIPFGAPGWMPVPGDYDGDGKADLALYHPPSGLWVLLQSTAGVGVVPFGVPGLVPVPADYDGDGRTDLALNWPHGTRWYLLQSSAGLRITDYGPPDGRPQSGRVPDPVWLLNASLATTPAASPSLAPVPVAPSRVQGVISQQDLLSCRRRIGDNGRVGPVTGIGSRTRSQRFIPTFP